MTAYNDDNNYMTVHTLTTQEGGMLNPQFRFTNAHYEQFEIATIVCSSISMVAAAMVIGMYIYLHIHNPRDANRVSLHCVIAATGFSFVSQIVNLAAMRSDVNSLYCSAFRILSSLVSLESSCLLAMVGIYLVLVFYFHIRHWPCRPEYILFPVSIIYTIIGNLLGFIENSVPPGFRTIFLTTKDECWYYSNFIDRLYTKDVWVYYYAFVFFITAVSFFCSLLAMYKVHVDQVANQEKLIRVATRNSDQSFLRTPSPQSSSHGAKTTIIERQISSVQNMIAHSIQSHSDSFSKIVLRTLLYPLTPLLVHIFGFSLQMHLINESHIANYGVVMMSIVLARMEGTLIACIFFVDPSVLKILHDFWLKLKSFLCVREQPLTPQRPCVTITASRHSSSSPTTLTPSSNVHLDPHSPGL